MVEALNLQSLMDEIQMRYADDKPRVVGIILARYETKPAQEVIEQCYRYWHMNTDKKLDIFWPGYGKYLPKNDESDTKRILRFEGNKNRIYFDLEAFINVKNQIFDHYSIEYEDKLQLILVNYRSGELHFGESAKIDLEYDLDENLTKIRAIMEFITKQCRKGVREVAPIAEKLKRRNMCDLYLPEVDFVEESGVLPASNEERLDADIEAAEKVLCDLIKYGELLCNNATYNSSSFENSMNDYLRDLFVVDDYYEVKDQTRHGISETGKRAGSVDLLLSKDGKEVAIFEGLKLSSVDSIEIKKHIDKAIVNYNALGTPTFVVAYVSSANFGAFFGRYVKFLQDYKYPIAVKSSLISRPAPNAAMRVASMMLTRDGYDFPVYFLALNVG